MLYFPGENVSAHQVIDLFRVCAYLHWKIFKKVHWLSQNLFYDAGLNKVDVCHFFNSISLVNKPWISTFETSLPRMLGTGRLNDLGYKRLAHDSCKKLIALSSCAAHIQRATVERDAAGLAGRIMEKVEVLHPPQRVLCTTPLPANRKSEAIHFVLIGADFFRKGGGRDIAGFRAPVRPE